MIKICYECREARSKTKYTKDKELKNYFIGLEKIDINYSQIYQDIFVLSVLNGKENGTYLEIGSGHQINGSNTYLLEKEFGWKGIGIDINLSAIINLEITRKNLVLELDATKANYEKILSDNFLHEIDYLQIDCDPPKQSYEILTKIPFEKYKFAVITFEHDYYCDLEKKYRSLSRKFLTSKGYILVAGNMGVDPFLPFEDWWVHPDLISEPILNKFKNNIDKNNAVEEYMLKDFKFVADYKCNHK